MPKFADPPSFLVDVDPGILFLAISDQRPATIALVLSHVPGKLAVQVAGKLGADLRGRVLQCLASQAYCSFPVLNDVLQATQQRVSEIERSAGPARAAKILRQCQPAVESSLLRSLDQRDPRLSEQIRTTLLTFDDIAWLRDQSMQTLLKNVDLSTWAMALKQCSDAIKQKVTRNLNERATRQLREQADYLRFASDEEIEQAKRRIVAVARHLQQPMATPVA